MTFSELNLIPPLLKAAHDAGYETPSPIQEQAIPPVLAGRDLLGCAQTGTGKTAAFAMPILQRLFTSPACGTGKRPIRALILTPTRELALQIDESFADYGKYMKLRPCVIFGGVNQNPQVAKLKAGVDVLTATPGRLNDLIQQGFIHLGDIEVFVLDEADRMLDMGFVHDVKRIIKYLPAKRQTLLFSATMPREIEQLADTLLHDPAKVMVTPPATTVEKIDQSLYFVDKGNKRYLLASLLKNAAVTNALVFTRTKHGADRVVRELSHEGIEAMAIHGNKSQNARQDALGRFKDGRIRVLIATDIAARGIDVSGLSHVFNYDLPNIPETYVHRIGRTARAGQEGIAISFCDFEEKAYLSDIEKLIKTQIPVVTKHDWPMRIFEVIKSETKPRGQRAPRTESSAGTGGRAQRAPAAAARQPQPAGRTARAAQTQQTAQTGQAEKTAAHRRTAANEKSEGASMENSEATRAAVPAGGAAQAAGETKPARRRRRGGRHNKAKEPGAAQGAPTQGAAPAAAQNGARPAQSAPQNAPRANAGRNPRQNQNAGGRGSRNNQREEQRDPRRDEVHTGPRTEPRTVGYTALGAAGVSNRDKPAPPLADKDDSIQVISRKVVAQKFTSFDEYMKAHDDVSDTADSKDSTD
ncbi:MAG: DEAD/DEAH box helicase [Ruthenibacterium sp.]